MNVAGVRIDGEDAILVDVDNDNTFDVLAMDTNHNGDLEDNEIVDISDQHITTAQLGGSPNADGGLVADTDVEPDYTESTDGIDA